MQPDGESAFGEAAGDAGGGLTAHVDQEVERVEAPERALDRLAVDDLRRLSYCEGGRGHYRAQQQVVGVEDAGEPVAVPFELAEGEGNLPGRPGHGFFNQGA